MPATPSRRIPLRTLLLMVLALVIFARLWWATHQQRAARGERTPERRDVPVVVVPAPAPPPAPSAPADAGTR